MRIKYVFFIPGGYNMHYLVIFLVALLISLVGFRKYIWFTSIGYGFSIAAMGITMALFFRRYMSGIMLFICLLLFIYGCRLGGYLLIRELKVTSYAAAMKNEKAMSVSFLWRIVSWIGCSLLYTLEVSPILFRLSNGGTYDLSTCIGAVIMVIGLLLESTADMQKAAAKKKNPEKYVNTGLYRIVRCPNYLGEIVFWTGVYVSGVTAFRGPIQWILATLGYLCIGIVMFAAALRQEMRQDRKYGNDSRYRRYTRTGPILLPFVPLFSLAKLLPDDEETE